MVEMLTCIKDWEEGNARTQHTVENKELKTHSLIYILMMNKFHLTLQGPLNLNLRHLLIHNHMSKSDLI
jgi:hypothetical protein